jgi:hypothetical protein
LSKFFHVIKIFNCLMISFFPERYSLMCFCNHLSLAPLKHRLHSISPALELNRCLCQCDVGQIIRLYQHPYQYLPPRHRSSAAAVPLPPLVRCLEADKPRDQQPLHLSLFPTYAWHLRRIPSAARRPSEWLLSQASGRCKGREEAAKGRSDSAMEAMVFSKKRKRRGNGCLHCEHVIR